MPPHIPKNHAAAAAAAHMGSDSKFDSKLEAEL